jgi:quercetin dioxygenase-like cupin family protein
MNHALLATGAAVPAAAETPAAARGTTQGVVKLGETITPLFKRGVPNVRDKAPLVAEVLLPPDATSSPHTHPKSAFIYAYVQLVFPDPN